MLDALAEKCASARRDPALRPEFYRALWEAELYAVGTTEGSGETGEYHFSFFEVEGREVLPFFSSLELFNEVIPEGQQHLIVPAQQLLTGMPEDVVLMLNPCTEAGKEFTSTELKALAAGLLFEAYEPLEAEDEEEEQIVLGEPKEVPALLIAGLKRHLPSLPFVKKASVILTFIPSRGRMPFPVVGLELDENAGASYLDLMLDLHVYVRDKVDKELYVEFHEIRHDYDGEIDRYFRKETKPFYEWAEA